MNDVNAKRWITGLIAVAVLALPACSMRQVTNHPIEPSYVSAEAREAPATPLDPDHRLFLDPVTLTAVPTE